MSKINDRETAFNEAVSALVDWWGDKITTNNNKNNGDNSNNGLLASLIANKVSNNHQININDNQINLFKESLTNSIEKYRVPFLKKEMIRISIGCDYDPDEMLMIACEEAGIDNMCIPWKTYSKISSYNDYIQTTAKFTYYGSNESLYYSTLKD